MHQWSREAEEVIDIFLFKRISKSAQNKPLCFVYPSPRNAMNRLPASLFRILRAQRPQPLVQRRNFNLWNTVAGGASSRYLHKKILDFEPASGLYPPPESTTFELLQYHDAGKPTLSKVTVAEYLKSIARSGTMLVPREKRPDAVSPNGTEGPKAQEAMVRRYILKPVKVPTGNSILSNKKTNKFKYKPAHQYHLVR